MSEGYVCDRCGIAREGTPHLELSLGNGIPRVRRYGEPRREMVSLEGQEKHYAVLDVCKACENDLKEWWQNGGGDIGDILDDE